MSVTAEKNEKIHMHLGNTVLPWYNYYIDKLNVKTTLNVEH